MIATIFDENYFNIKIEIGVIEISNVSNFNKI